MSASADPVLCVPLRTRALPRRMAAALGVSAAFKLAIVCFRMLPGHIALSVAFFTVPDIWMWLGLLLPNASWMVATERRFRTDRKQVWITIDDGPDPSSTPAILDLLDRYGARATFFAVGKKAAAHPELIREIARRGHTVGNHSLSHPLKGFWLAGPNRTWREVDGCQRVLLDAGSGKVEFFRPPVGIKTFFLAGTLYRQGLVNLGWTARGREQFSKDPGLPLRRLKRGIRPGAILLLHESGRRSEVKFALLASLLAHLKSEGFESVIPRIERNRTP